jgi:archaellum component FlaF (FlaF/FlaG flagellin family)
MESGIPALLIAAVLMLSTVFLARGGFMGMDAVGQQLKASEVNIGAQNRTAVTATEESIDPTGTNITITVLNSGETDISQYSQMDVVLQYFDENGVRYDKWIPFTSGALNADTWTTGAFINDAFEPRILNPGESMEILIRVNPAVGAGTTNKAVIGTDKGVTLQTYFSGPP